MKCILTIILALSFGSRVFAAADCPTTFSLWMKNKCTNPTSPYYLSVADPPDYLYLDSDGILHAKGFTGDLIGSITLQTLTAGNGFVFNTYNGTSPKTFNLSNSFVRGLISGTSPILYDNSTGVISFSGTATTATQVSHKLTFGTGITASSSTFNGSVAVTISVTPAPTPTPVPANAALTGGAHMKGLNYNGAVAQVADPSTTQSYDWTGPHTFIPAVTSDNAISASTGSGYGVLGITTSGPAGVYGQSVGNNGVVGLDNTGVGVLGESANGTAVEALAQSGIGLGVSSTSGTQATFINGIGQGVQIENRGLIATSSTLRIRGGSPGTGKVLTATDSVGNSTWQTASVPSITSGTLSVTSPLTVTAGRQVLGGAATVAIPASTNSVDGYLTAADHTSFAAKQAAGNYITAMTGPVTASGPGSVASSITNNAITNAMIRQGVARSVIGVTGNATANVADIQGTANQVLRVNSAGTALAFGSVADASLSANVFLLNQDNAVLGANTFSGSNQFSNFNEFTMNNQFDAFILGNGGATVLSMNPALLGSYAFGDLDGTGTPVTITDGGGAGGVFINSGSGSDPFAGGILYSTDTAGQIDYESPDTLTTYGNGGTPTIAAGTGAGTGATISLATGSKDLGGVINLTAGLAPAVTSTIATISFSSTASNVWAVTLTPNNTATAALSSTISVTGATTTFTINAGATGLTNAIAYKWSYNARKL